MSEYMNQELILFARSIWAGVLVVAAYDILRVWRRICRHGFFWIAVEDLIYWCACGIYLFSKMYRENDGIIRTYALSGVLLGVLIYHYSISELLVKYIALFLNKIIKFLIIPLKWYGKLIKRLKFRLLRCRIFLREQIVRLRTRKRENEKAGKEETIIKKKESKERAESSSHD